MKKTPAPAPATTKKVPAKTATKVAKVKATKTYAPRKRAAATSPGHIFPCDESHDAHLDHDDEHTCADHGLTYLEHEVLREANHIMQIVLRDPEVSRMAHIRDYLKSKQGPTEIREHLDPFAPMVAIGVMPERTAGKLVALWWAAQTFMQLVGLAIVRLDECDDCLSSIDPVSTLTSCLDYNVTATLLLRLSGMQDAFRRKGRLPTPLYGFYDIDRVIDNAVAHSSPPTHVVTSKATH